MNVQKQTINSADYASQSLVSGDAKQSDIIYTLPPIPVTRKDLLPNRLLLTRAIVPRSFLIVIPVKNTFILTEGISSVIVSITPGMYNKKTMQSELQNVLTTFSPNGYNYSVSFNAISGHFIYTVTGNAGQQPSITLYPRNVSKVYEFMGFEEDTTVNFVADTLESVGVLRINTENVIQIRISSNNENPSSILATLVAADSPTFGNINYTYNDATYDSVPFNYQEKFPLRIKLTDENGVLVDTQLLNWVFELSFYYDDTMKKFEKNEKESDRQSSSLIRLQEISEKLKSLVDISKDGFVGLLTKK